MGRPTQEQIVAETQKLRDMEPKVRHYSMFGDDNRAKIRYQIEVLEGKRDESDVGRELDDDLRSEGEMALDWMNGNSVEGSPSDGWQSLVDE